MSKILLILPFVFVFIGIFTVIYIIYTTINEKRRKKLRDEEFKKIKANAENAAKQLEEKQALKAQIEDKI